MREEGEEGKIGKRRAEAVGRVRWEGGRLAGEEGGSCGQEGRLAREEGGSSGGWKVGERGGRREGRLAREEGGSGGQEGRLRAEAVGRREGWREKRAEALGRKVRPPSPGASQPPMIASPGWRRWWQCKLSGGSEGGTRHACSAAAANHSLLDQEGY